MPRLIYVAEHSNEQDATGAVSPAQPPVSRRLRGPAVVLLPLHRLAFAGITHDPGVGLFGAGGILLSYTVTVAPPQDATLVVAV